MHTLRGTTMDALYFGVSYITLLNANKSRKNCQVWCNNYGLKLPQQINKVIKAESGNKSYKMP